MPDTLKVAISQGKHVTALFYGASKSPRIGITLLLGHGAGGNQNSGFMVQFAGGLAARGLDVVTFNFLYSEERRKVPDRTEALEECYRAAIKTIRQTPQLKRNRWAIGGKSLGGRIASQVAAAGDEFVAGLSALVFLGYPLHPPGKPDQLRSRHLEKIKAPMLFVQGSRDSFGTPDELRLIIEGLGTSAKMYVVEGGDHSLNVSKKSPLSQEQV
ncbi:MAG TPA: alpha/beta family hydrolase, partial [Acidobacteriota bacterium]|nr:alpha/beta family hydrolase [Acidobacteriota bacterium]